MLKQLVVEGKTIVVGDECIITKRGFERGFGPIGAILIVWGFKRIDGMLIGLKSSLYNKTWADLDGAVAPGYGLWITPSGFANNMILSSIRYKIVSKFMFKGKDLASTQCRILHKCMDNYVFIESDENIGGGSCDGLGKSGHCTILPYEKLRRI